MPHILTAGSKLNSPIMTKRDKSKIATKSRICKSALELFSVVGYFQTSIAEITTNAHISKGLFYHYYWVFVFNILLTRMISRLKWLWCNLHVK